MMRLMITTMRDEAPFILEWIAYHRLIGFTDFLIYSNDCADGTDAMLDRLAELGIVTHVPNPRRGRKTVQWQALTRARNHRLTRRAEWIMVADVDEFLVIHAGEGRLDDLFAAVPDATGFAVPWRMFGSSGRIRFEEELVTAQFTRAAPDRMLWPLRAGQFKSLFRRDPRLVRLGVHRPLTEEGEPVPGQWVDGNGRPFTLTDSSFAVTAQERYGLAQINHYALGSTENFLVKMARGRPNHMDRPIDLGYWVERNFNAIEDRRILRYLDGLRAGVEAFLADDVLGRLYWQAIAWRRRRIAEALTDHQQFLLFTRLVQCPDTPVLPMELQMELHRMRLQAHPVKKPPRPRHETDADTQRRDVNS
ncbi:glycosyltransferase family 2 protein [Paracoccus sp. MC1862]|uniref:glycosyltransferase family 2 protein n=2 Tax=Paracoccus sp. MC1862 TaxID=2760307 RepID=UPI0016003BB1|nr:glycosyltransferase family 2 protein [Paracoccus sp. MC1862]MBB1499007.1 glycosyltransferase family 2 protein [Paracoccus sp. MC1862]